MNPIVAEEEKGLGLPDKAEIQEKLKDENYWKATTVKAESSDAIDFQVWLYTHYQSEMEDALSLILKEVKDESKPFEFKYEGRDKLKKLIEDLQAQDGGQESVAKSTAKAIVLKHLGVATMDCEELSDAQTLLIQALAIFNELPLENKLRYINEI